MHAKDARHAGGGCCSVDQVHGWEPPPLQFTCCSDWSCHTSLYGRPDSWTSFAHAGLSIRPFTNWGILVVASQPRVGTSNGRRWGGIVVAHHLAKDLQQATARLYLSNAHGGRAVA